MLVVRTIEDPTHPVGKLVCPEQSIGLHHLSLCVEIHFGSMALSHGLCFGRRQLTILTPQPLSLTWRLCFPSHLLSSLEMCQEALSHTRRRTFFPAA
jgi:hypothetical protein